MVEPLGENGRHAVAAVQNVTPGEFVAKWRSSELKERSASQGHFIDLCPMLGEPTPAEAVRQPHDLYEQCRSEAHARGGETFANLARRGIVEEADRLREKRTRRQDALAQAAAG